MAIKTNMLLISILLLSFWCIVSYSVRDVMALPSGACFVPTKLSTPYEELPKPLISPESPGYNEIYNQFINPMLKSIKTNLHIINSSREYVGNSKGQKRIRKTTQYRKMLKNVEVYYIDHFNDPKDADISVGIWSISFGQFVFKFTEPIPGIPDTIIFNGLLPAVGVTHTNIQQWSQKYPNGKPKEEEEEEEDEKEENGTRIKKTNDSDDKKQEKDEEEEEEKDRKRRSKDLFGEHVDSVNGESSLFYDQTITPNGDTGKSIEFWVVHNDPDDTTAYAIAASSNKHLFSDTWTDINQYCRKHGSNLAKEEYGDCEGLHNDIDEHMVKYLGDDHYCKKIVLCKNGVFKFRFKHHLPHNFNRFYISAARLTEPCHNSECVFQRLVYVTVKYDDNDKTSAMCPSPSIKLNFQCSLDWKIWKKKEDIFSDYEFKPSIFYGNDRHYMYRVIPPQKPKGNEEEEQEEEMRDPFKCKEKTARHRPRFQIQTKKGTIKTCCISDPPMKGTGPSIPYYWPETRSFDAMAEAEQSNDEDPRTRNRIPASAIVGKAPKDPKFPSQGIRDRVVGYRMDHGMSKKDAYEKLVTKEEYEAIIKSEEAVKNPANPDEHKVSNNTVSLSIIHACCLVIIPLVFIGISSFFLLPNISFY